MYRAHFLDELVKGVPAQRAHFNKRLENLEENDGNVTLYFKDGTTATADVAIGTDGIHSKVREHLIGAEAAKSVFAGSVVFRDLIPMTKAVEMLGSEHAQNARLLCGPGMTVPSSKNLPKLTIPQAELVLPSPSTLERHYTSPSMRWATKSGRMRSG